MNFNLSGNRVNPLFSNTLPPAPHVMSFKPVNNCAMNASFFDKHGIRLIQAPMAGSQNHRLAAAVFLAGGLGSIPAAMLTTEQLPLKTQLQRKGVRPMQGPFSGAPSCP
jgi:hypothetical protein